MEGTFRSGRGWRRAGGVGVVASMVIGVVISVTALGAVANPGNIDYYPTCQNTRRVANIYESPGDYSTRKDRTAFNSTCNDINVLAHPCASAWVRYYPSSGGFYDGPRRPACDGAYVLASGVLNGTRYAIVAENCCPHFHIED